MEAPMSEAPRSEAPRSLRKSRHRADRRVRELYRYFKPSKSLQSPLSENVPATAAAPPDVTLTSSDPFNPDAFVDDFRNVTVLGVHNTTLTSFAQLAALRLNAQRAMICVLERDSQFVLAEATKSLGISDPFVRDRDDNHVWTGSSNSSESWSLCKDTVALPPFEKTTDQCPFLVIDDLSKDDRFTSLPFVQGPPNFRFYAGIPLTTENNVNIGCLFVLDTESRDGLAPAERETLISLSMLSMNYLNVSRQASDGQRATRLSRGLSCFVEGNSSFVDSAHQRHPRSSSSRSGASPPAVSIQKTSLPDMPRADVADARSGCSGSPLTQSSSVSDGKMETGTSLDFTSSFPDWTEIEWKGSSPDESHWLFRRAANLLRESLELDGDGCVAFLDATSGPTDCQSTDSSDPAPILAVSTKDDPFAPKPGSTTSCPVATMDRNFLHQLLHRHPKGKLWSFYRDGSMPTSDDDESPRNRPSSLSQPPKSVERYKDSRGKNWKAVENSFLNRYFPHASQVLFAPLWNAASSQWFAGCFCWNTVETHVFSDAVELSSVLGFGSSIMAEWSRVQSLIADQQKGDFIGSISHELRSPLHGILAATELIESTALNEFQDSLVQAVNACGRTLLDTVNQILDYSKIVSVGRNGRHFRRSREMDPKHKATDNGGSQLDTSVYTDVAVLAEEVVEGVCLGHTYGNKPTLSMSVDQSMLLPQAPARRQSMQSVAHGLGGGNDVEVNFDIAHNDWVYKTQPGALRRIVMNVFGNAIKYTPGGRVTLELAVNEPCQQRDGNSYVDDSEQADLVTLTISDTGEGISQDFLRTHIYTPFAQENTLTAGTGLGLSIVRKIVKSLNGNMLIQSRPNEGTVVKVSLPLKRPVDNEKNPAATPEEDEQEPFTGKRDAPVISLLREGYVGRKVAIWGVHPANATTHSRWGIIARYLTNWYGLELVPWPASTSAVDILVVEENDLPADVRDRGDLPTSWPPLLVFCRGPVGFTKSRLLSAASSVHIVCSPYGPHKLANSILRCLNGYPRESSPHLSLSANHQYELPERPKDREFLTGDKPPAHSDSVLETFSQEKSGDGNGDSDSPGTHSHNLATQSESVESASAADPPMSAVTTPSPFSPSSHPYDFSGHQSPPQPPPPPQLSRVLVVDDNSINRNLMLAFMKKRKYLTLDSAEDGKLAVEAVEKDTTGYDIIFMDISMPVMDGFEATRVIRSLEKERDNGSYSTVIALTGLSSSSDESEAMASGFDLFLTKPVSFKEVSRLLDEWETNGRPSQQNNRGRRGSTFPAG